VPQDIDPISQLPDDAQLLKQQLRASANEVQRLKLMVDKLKLQLARRVRAQFGTSSERFDLQASLIEPVVLAQLPVRQPAAPAANAGSVDRSLPPHLPREQWEIRPSTSPAHHDAQVRLAAARPAAVGCAASAPTSRSTWNTCRRASRSSAPSDPSWRARSARPSSRPARRAGRSHKGWQARRCWRM
jgi:hypothetical protein